MGRKVFFIAPCKANIVYFATREKKIYFASVKFDARAKRGKNHTSKINVFPVLHTIFFLLLGQTMNLFAPHRAIKSTLWPASRKNPFLVPTVEKKIVCNTGNGSFCEHEV